MHSSSNNRRLSCRATLQPTNIARDVSRMSSGDTEPGFEASAASNTMDMDLTPPKKRVKSAQASRSASTEPTARDAESARDDTADTLPYQSELRENAIKMEVEDTTSALTAIPIMETASSAHIKSEPLPAEASTSSAAKKKKTTTSATKKEVSASGSTSKSKRASASTKKSTPSAAHDASTSRSRVRVEIASPPPSHNTIAAPKQDEEDEEDNALYCICQRRQGDVEGGMIMCDRCEQWYHYRCMDITEDDAELVDQFICPPCHQVTGEKTTYKAACSRADCRRAAMTPFSKYCSQRCGVLAVTAKMAVLKVEKNKAAVAVLEADQTVAAARKTEAFTTRTEKFDGEWWKRAVAEPWDGLAGAGSIQRLGLADAFASMVKANADQGVLPSNGTENKATINGVTAPHESLSTSSGTSPETSSATSLISINERHTLITNQISLVDRQKSRLNARLDRLDLRSTLLHLVSDRVPTLSPVGSSTSTNTLDAAVDDDEETADSRPAKKKKKASSKTKTKSSTDTSGGPRCGYDQRLHWDDRAFDAWAHTPPGSSILAHETPLDGTLDDTDADPTQSHQRWICATAKRRCRRHVDWSNLCELALDAEKASLNTDSRVLTQRKLALVAASERLQVEAGVVKRLAEEEAKREKRREEERDRDVAMRMANEGSRRGGVV